MGCNYPLVAFERDTGEVIFSENRGRVSKIYKTGGVVKELRLPCGKCDGCRLERARQWAVRCMHEAAMYRDNCFITLTYNNERLPHDEGLHYEHFQLFMKRLRRRFACRKIKFFMCGEYGDRNGRPHFHACLFNIDFHDRVYFKTTKAGSKIFTSATLQALWVDSLGRNRGFTTVGTLNFDSAGYVARYTLKKRRGLYEGNHHTIDLETGEQIERAQEFTRMSLKNGIGYNFYRRWFSDIFPQDIVVINGVEQRPPKYYYKKLEKDDKDMYNLIREQRESNGIKYRKDNTPERLEVKEKVLNARSKLLIRELS